ncbi:DUF917 domain-containing protein [Streptomyces buecherae]|uniref:DUF917 domain-containing protein n=1 Tax=Streptomyces buecherae TaxID=2763006 RepID=UPI001C2611B8|nr:DUF917 domain-containing protein [Streptomyces buecherae]
MTARGAGPVRAIGAEDVPTLWAGAQFYAPAFGEDGAEGLREWVTALLAEHGPVPLVRAEALPPTTRCAALGLVGSGTALAELPPVGDEFTTALSGIERRLGQRVEAVFPLAAAALNALTPLVAACLRGLPLIDSDGMGRVFPLVQYTSLHLAGLPVGPVCAAGPAGESLTVEAASADRVETMLRAQVHLMGGWAATASYPCAAAELRRAGLHGTVSRLLAAGRVLLAGGPVDRVVSQLSAVTGCRSVGRGRVVEVEQLTRPMEWAQPAHASTVLVAESGGAGRLLQLELQNDILLVLADGALTAAVPDVICLLDAVRGGVVGLDSLGGGEVVEVLVMPAAPVWYSSAGLALAGPRAFGLPVEHPRVAR